MINPMIVRGQVQGGVVQGIGQALFEHTAYDPDSGQLLSGSFMDYALPRAADLPDIEVEFLEVPCLSNPLGVKGAGEAGAVGSPPAVMNAVLNALAGNIRDGLEGAGLRQGGLGGGAAIQGPQAQPVPSLDRRAARAARNGWRKTDRAEGSQRKSAFHYHQTVLKADHGGSSVSHINPEVKGLLP